MGTTSSDRPKGRVVGILKRNWRTPAANPGPGATGDTGRNGCAPFDAAQESKSYLVSLGDEAPVVCHGDTCMCL